MSLEPFAIGQSNTKHAESYTFLFDPSITEISNFLIFTFSITSDAFHWLHILNKICLTEDFNSSLTSDWTLKFGNPYEIVVIPVVYWQDVQEIQSISSVYRIFYRKIFSEISMFFWLNNHLANQTLMFKTNAFLKLQPVIPIIVGAPSLNFFAKQVTEVSDKFSLNLSDVLNLNKKLLWNCKAKIIQGVVLVRLDTPAYFAKYLDDTYACLNFIAWRSNNTVYCSSGLMSALYISQSHNITLNILDRTRPEQFTNLWESANNVEYFLTRNVGPSDPIQLPNYETRAKMFSSVHEAYPVYCERNILKKEPNSDTLIWIVAFTPELWLQIIVMFLLLSFLHKKRTQVRNRMEIKEIENIMFVVVSSLTLQPTFKHILTKGRLVALAIIWMALFICTIYGNSIVSVITVPPQPNILKSLPEALNLGFKFVWNPGYYFGATYESFFRAEFKSLGVYHLINDSSIPGDWALFYTKRFVDEKLMFALYDVNLIPHTKLFLRGAEVALGKKGGAICYTIPDSVHKHFSIWEMRVSNRQWLLLTAARISESGLIEKWDEWANLAFLQNIDEDEIEIESLDELNLESAIDFDKFVKPCVLLVTLSVISGIIFFLEVVASLFT